MNPNAIGLHLPDLRGIDARLAPLIDAARVRIRYSFKLALAASDLGGSRAGTLGIAWAVSDTETWPALSCRQADSDFRSGRLRIGTKCTSQTLRFCLSGARLADLSQPPSFQDWRERKGPERGHQLRPNR